MATINLPLKRRSPSSISHSTAFVTFVILGSCHGERLFDPPTKVDSLWREASNLSVRLWSWNSGKKDLSKEAQQLATTDADVLITCQQEAKRSIGKYLDQNPQWLRVAYGQHDGFTGPRDYNSQMLSIFVRNHAKEFHIEAPPAKLHWTLTRSLTLKFTISLPSLTGDFVEVKNRANELVLKVRLGITALDRKGKGGVMANLWWPEVESRRAASTTFACLHLSSESDQERHRGIQEAIELARQLSPQVTQSTVLMGDLNFRLCVDYDGKTFTKSHGEPFAVDQWDFLKSFRRARILAPLDPLYHNPGSRCMDQLVDESGFTCNSPYALYLPTYKRYGEECTSLGEALSRCEDSISKQHEACMEGCSQRLTLCIDCYIMCYEMQDRLYFQCDDPEGRNLTTLFSGCYNAKSLPVKKSTVQIGWLDRFCYRVEHKSEISMSIADDEGWMATPGKANKQDGSDHMPVAATAVFSY